MTDFEEEEMIRSRRFEVDKSEAKMLGVCAGIARHVGIDPTIVRIGLVVATIAGGWPWTAIAYVVLAIIGRPGRRAALADHRPEARAAAAEMRDLDRRLAEIDVYVASSNRRLAREIDELR
jgi:phage shock protein C